MDRGWQQVLVSALVTGLVTGLIVGLFVWMTITRIVDEVPALRPRSSMPRGSNTSIYTPEPEVTTTTLAVTTRR